jgi:hypothetical protein
MKWTLFAVFLFAGGLASGALSPYGEMCFPDGAFSYRNFSFVVVRDPFVSGPYLIRGYHPPTMGSFVIKTYDGVALLPAGDSLLVCRDPFCGEAGIRSIQCEGLDVQVLAPVNGSVYYFPHVSPNFTFYVSGFNPECFYRVDGHLWNNVSCVQGNNSKVITLPPGANVSVEFKVVKRDCEISDQVQLTVYYHNPKGNPPLMGFYMFALVFIIILLDRRRLRNRSLKHRGEVVQTLQLVVKDS